MKPVTETDKQIVGQINELDQLTGLEWEFLLDCYGERGPEPSVTVKAGDISETIPGSDEETLGLLRLLLTAARSASHTSAPGEEKE